MNVIPCVTWVRRGVAAAEPDKVQLTPKELDEIIKQTKNELEEAECDSEDGDNPRPVQNKPEAKDPNAMEDDEFGLENYDDESGDIQCTIGGLAVINPDGKDPYLTTGNDDDNDSEREDDIIKPDDNLVIFGHVEADASVLEIHVHNEREGSFYCHHDILLPSFPLCIEWLNFESASAKPGNFCAMGNMTPIIDVWDLDLVNSMLPAFQLGRKASKKKKQTHIGHKDAVLDIAWNKTLEHVLASGSVDQTILLWDLELRTPSTTLNQFEEKVQAIKWHPSESYSLLTGSADKMTRLFDCRTEDSFKSWEATGEVERVLWNHFDPNYFFISTSKGIIECIDVRQSKHVWEVVGHETEVTGLSLSASCPGLLVTCSNDGMMKVWDAFNPQVLEPVFEKMLTLGSIQCLASNPDSPFIFAFGGDNKENNSKVWDLREITEVSDRFHNRQLVMTEVNNSTTPESEMMDVADDSEAVASTSKKSKHKKH